jgi:hypothetical protein
MRLAGKRSGVATIVVVLDLFTILLAAFGILGLVQAQYLPATVLLVFAALVLAGAYMTSRSAVYVDDTWVGRTAPWPRRCARAQLREIRYIGALGAPGWAFVRKDGKQAFSVSLLLFERPGIERLAQFIGVPVR